MDKLSRTHLTFILVMATCYVTLVAVAINGLRALPEGTPRTLALGLYLAFGVVVTVAYFVRENPFYIHAYLLIETLIISAIFWIDPIACKDAPILFFVLSSTATLFLPLRMAIPWIIGMHGVTMVNVMAFYGPEAFWSLLSPIGGHMMFGSFGALLRRADADRQQAEQLLTELQEAHQQLQEYAQQAQRLAVVEERNRLAREMHDALGHRLTVAVLQLEGARRLIPTEPERAGNMVGTMREQLKEALAELRKTVAALRTDDALTGVAAPDAKNLSVKTFEEDIAHLVQTFQEATGLSVHLHLSAQIPTLPPSHRLALYRAAQESLTNVQRHAAATQAWVDIREVDEYMVLKVEDDGQGMPELIEDGRFGLKGLKERARQLEGQFTIQERIDGGTQISFQLPLESGQTPPLQDERPSEPSIVLQEELAHV